MEPSSLEVSDQQAAAVATAPRVTLESMQGKIVARYDLNAAAAVGPDVHGHPALGVLSICIIVMENGFTVIGKSAPASPENYHPELGAKFAYEDAVRQVWPLEGYALREKLSENPIA